MGILAVPTLLFFPSALVRSFLQNCRLRKGLERPLLGSGYKDQSTLLRAPLFLICCNPFFLEMSFQSLCCFKPKNCSSCTLFPPFSQGWSQTEGREEVACRARRGRQREKLGDRGSRGRPGQGGEGKQSQWTRGFFRSCSGASISELSAPLKRCACSGYLV